MIRNLPLALLVGLALIFAASAQAEEPPPGANDFACNLSAEHPRPVVLVHGLGASMSANWSYMSPRLADAGYCVFALTYGKDPRLPEDFDFGAGSIPMEQSSTELDAFVDEVLAATGARKVDIVGHSEGTVMPRYFLERLGGAEKVHRFVALAPLWRGTELGGAAILVELGRQYGLSAPVIELFSSFCGSCPQFIKGSDYLNDLNADGEAVPGVEHFNIVTRYDGLVSPPTSGVMKDGGTNIILQDLCPANLSEHGAVAFDPAVLALFKIALDPENPVKMPAGCTQPEVTRTPARPVCVAEDLAVDRRGIGELTVGTSRIDARKRLGTPTEETKKVWRYCVDGGGELTVVFARKGPARLVASTAAGHELGDLGPGDSADGLKRVSGPIHRAPGGPRSVFFGVADGQVSYVAVSNKRLAGQNSELIRAGRFVRARGDPAGQE